MATALLERELKFVPATSSFDLTSFGEPLEPRNFVSTYLDTPTRSLARSGITFRRRVENGLSSWQLKLPVDDGRLELEQRAGPTPPEELLGLLAVHLRAGAKLEPVAVLRTRRTGVLVKDGDTEVAEVVLDRVEVLDERRVVGAFEELEAELRDGDGDDLRLLGKRLRKAGAKTSNGLPKVMRVIGEQRAGRSAARDTAGRLVEAVDEQVAELLLADALLRRGDDPEIAHRFRVATRRLRAFMRAGREVFGEQIVEPVRAELAWLGSSAGRARDLDVLRIYLEPELAELPVADRRAARPLLTRLKRERRSAGRRLRATLDDPRYHALLDELEALVSRPPQTGEPPSLADLAGREYTRLRKDYKALGKTPSDEALHAVRIRVKRVRYAAELAAPVAGKGAAEVIARAKALQDVIGEHQDAAVAEEWLRSTPQVAEPSGASLAAGMLVERQRARRRAARQEVDNAWRKLDAAGRAAFS